MSSTLSKNQRKKLAKKLKTDGTAETAAPAPVAAPVVAKAAVAVKEVKKVEKVAPVVAPKENKITEKKAGPVSRTLDGGLIITDSKIGDGAVAKNGKKIGMRYIGKLDNGKIFDSNTKGSPVRFPSFSFCSLAQSLLNGSGSKMSENFD